jgi:putative oxidoreductase
MNKKSTFIILASGILIIVFFYAPISKWEDFPAFVHQMDNQPFGPGMRPVLLYVLPSLELLAAILLTMDRSRAIGLGLTTLLMTLFTGYIILIKLHFYGRIPCSCGGVIGKLNWTQHLLFNFTLLGLSALALLFSIQRPGASIQRPYLQTKPFMHKSG